MLTRKQYELLIFIDQRLKATGVSPSFDEMKDALDLKSKSGIHRLITGLEERGFIRRLPHRARALEVVKLPENVSRHRSPPTRPAPASAPNVIQGDFKSSLPGAAVGTPPRQSSCRSTARSPPARRSRRCAIMPSPSAFRPAMLGAGEHYALTVEGDSMVDAGIQDGDTVIIRHCDTAENGSIVVALIDDNEATLKRLRRKGASIALEPANQKYETRIFGPDRVKVQGRLVGLLRRY